ncbi:endonuclease [Gordoniibacillus kamchatkensis]|uniref:Endonuclease n=1 Tax=Gordoniibacillus kamchatkensis TaxID=1590651 RepID=A0ABR5AB28_9BACL|nr:YqaJ viral recombinase family protein [Paenibacillus sp. VKM B-2647]KIL38218.1 endonuclease [Paenibacillus sp. VKM B-2647]
MQALRLVNTKELAHEDWLDYRRKGIGGSDVAAICGMSRYKSPMEVYLDKIGELAPIEDNPKMKAGRILEPVIADWFAEETGYKVWKQNAIFQHQDHPFMLANIDRWLPGQNAGLEIKNTGEFSRDDWSGTQAPTEYIMQCNHYMAVTGAERWFIAVLIGGWDFQWKVIERDERLIQNLITIETEFWHNNVLAKVPPAYSHQDTDYLNERYAESSPGRGVDLPEEAYPIMQSLYEARAAKKASEMQEDTAKNQIKGIMQDAELAYFQGDLKFTWKANKNGQRTFKVVGGNE